MPAVRGTAVLERLEAPRLSSRTGVTLGGQSFGTAGTLSGRPTGASVKKTSRGFVVKLPAASAAMLTIARP
jgi:Glycosyl hydrolase family 79 C-terminal beta domain